MITNVKLSTRVDRFEADLIVNKLVIEKERKGERELFGKLKRNFVSEKFKDRWIWIKLPYFKFSYSFVLSFRIQFSHYLVLEIRTDNTVILFREFLRLLFLRIVKLCNFVWYTPRRISHWWLVTMCFSSSCHDSFSSSMEKHMTMSREKENGERRRRKQKNEKRKEDGGKGRKKRNIKRIVRKKGGEESEPLPLDSNCKELLRYSGFHLTQ